MKKGPKIALKQAKILDITLNSTSESRVLGFVRVSLIGQEKFFIVTPNPEILIRAQKDKSLKKILNAADISLPDGVGLAQAAKFINLPGPKFGPLRFFALLFQGAVVGLATFVKLDWLSGSLNLIRGRDMFLALLKLANQKNWRVFLLGGREGVAGQTAEILAKSLKKVRLAFSDGPQLNEKAKPVTKEDVFVEKKVVEKINQFKPHLLFVAFGAPKQEKWVYKWLPRLNVGGAMVVGGAFDYLAGRTNLPPAWMENLGLEWLWRLVKQPWRLRRIFTAFPIFPLKVFWHKLTVIGS